LRVGVSQKIQKSAYQIETAYAFFGLLVQNFYLPPVNPAVVVMS
jgi:hypothetical protein